MTQQRRLSILSHSSAKNACLTPGARATVLLSASEVESVPWLDIDYSSAKLTMLPEFPSAARIAKMGQHWICESEGDTVPFRVNGVEIVDTYAEAFSVTGTRVVVTAATQEWARIAAAEMSGYGTSVIACDAEAAVEADMPASETPDGRPGISVLLFAFNRDALGKAVTNRVGQCVLTCPTTACYNGISDAPHDKQIPVGASLRYFGDGFQISKRLADRRLWRIPVMDGEFVCEERFGTVRGVAGGNLLICGIDQESALRAAEAAVSAIRQVRDVIAPFPGGIVRSGSKVGSRYKMLKASTNDAYCPTLRAVTDSELTEEIAAVYEIVIDGLALEPVREAMRAGLHAVYQCSGVTRVAAGNYGGRLGQHRIFLRGLL